MKLDDLSTVQTLAATLWECIEARSEIDRLLEELDEQLADSMTQAGAHETPSTLRGESRLLLVQYRDGSGFNISLQGCYVTHDVLRATRAILETKIEHIERDLIAYGVDPKESR